MKRAFIRCSLAAALLGLTGCAPAPVGRKGAPLPKRATPLPTKSPQAPLGQTVKIPGKTADAECQFCCDLWRASAERSENLVFSPLGLTTGLGLLTTGASGETSAELTAALHQAGLDTAPIAQWLAKDLRPVADWHQRIYTCSTAASSSDFAAGAQKNFATDTLPLPAVEEIDRWLAQVTQGLVPRLANRDLSGIQVLLVNAFLLKLDWTTPFRPSWTHQADFRSPAGTVKVAMMQQEESLPFTQGPGFSIVEIPYGSDHRLVFDCVLPDKDDGLAAIEEALRWETLRPILTGLKKELVFLSLPRFELSCNLECNPLLQAVGIRRAFTAAAEFEKIGAGLYVTRAVQQTVLRVEEHGTVAAFVTEIPMASPIPPPHQDFVVDHPFLFFIRDRKTGLILVTGRVVNPPPLPAKEALDPR